jgi:hypothetical protein
VNAAFHPNIPTVVTEDVRRFLDLVAGCHGVLSCARPV